MTPNYTTLDLMALVALCLSLSPLDFVEDPAAEDPIEAMLLSLCDLDWKQHPDLTYWTSSSIAGEPVWINFRYQPKVCERDLLGAATNKIIDPEKWILSFYSRDPENTNFVSLYKYRIQTIESTNIDTQYTQAMSDIYDFIATTVASNFASKFIIR